MKIAIAQLNPTVGDLDGNSQQIMARAAQAVNQGARLLLTPELSLCGYPPRDLLLDPSFVAAIAQALEKLAQALPSTLAVLVGTVEPNPDADVQGGKPLFNSVAWLERGQIQQVFHKQLLPTYDVFDEDRYFESADRPNLFTLEGFRIGVTICEDLWNDEEFWGRRLYEMNPVLELVQQSVDVIVNLSASPFCVGKQQVREAMLQHSARRHHQPMIYVNQVGGNDDLIFDGRSLVLNRQGDVIAQGRAFEPDLFCVLFNPDKADLLPGPMAPDVREDNAEIWAALVLGVRDYARKCGFTQAVLGLSGGIDSALVAAIAATALGPENVLGVLMPSPYSSDHSITDAQTLATNLGIASETIPIAKLMQAYDQSLRPLFMGTAPGVAEENIQARIRGNLLMAIANKFDRLLISTGNKSEIAVGYCTLYGDMSGGLAAIADVPKTRVYRLSTWLNSKSELIPPHILTKPPSAELKPNQVDQDALPPYEVLDAILAGLIDQHQSYTQLVATGHDPEIVNRVIQLVQRAEFKRRQSPPGLKITDRAFGTGWRMPIAARQVHRATNPFI
jgi:NAD+ synthetase